MSRWWRDTLFKRLFLLMWFGLVGSHLLAYFTVTAVHPPPFGLHGLPVLPSLPPIGAPLGNDIGPAGGGTGGPPGRLPGAPFGEPGAPPTRPSDGPVGAAPGSAMPTSAFWLDYLIRVLVIGVVAWFGARWLSAPMRRLADASETLGRALGVHRPPTPLDALHGTLEVRQTAQVFNAMAVRLHAQFGAQALLMAAISHDLRTPLARLRLRLEMSDAADRERSIADVREMDALIGSVLGMLREQHEPVTASRIDLATLAQALVDDLAEQGEPAAFEPMPAGRLATIVTAPAAVLTRILGNLIGNALRHGGAASVRVEVASGEVRAVVDDPGPGIPPAQLDAVFEPFYRLDAARGRVPAGSGLGLYIARDLAERHGARLALANRPEGGLRATLSLKAA